MLRQWTVSALPRSFGRSVQRMSVCVAVVALTACSDGGGGDMTITPAPVDPPGSIAAAAAAPATPVGTPVRARFDSPDDEHYFRMQFTEPGTTTIATTGEASTEIAAFDKDGIELPSEIGSLIVQITAELIANKGGNAFIRITPAQADVGVGARDYTLRGTFEPGTPGTGTPTPATMTR